MAEKSFTINGQTLLIDLLDADVNETAMRAQKDAIEATNAIANDNARTEADKIRGVCSAVRKCFDDMFGVGTGVRVCGQSDKIDVCTDAYVSLREACEDQGKGYAKATEKRIEKLLAAKGAPCVPLQQDKR